METQIVEKLNEFRKEVDKIFVGKTPIFPEEMDKEYDCDIYIFRHPGMGNSKQIITGNKLSIKVATTSYLEILLRNGVLDEEELLGLVDMSIKVFKGCLEDEK